MPIIPTRPSQDLKRLKQLGFEPEEARFAEYDYPEGWDIVAIRDYNSYFQHPRRLEEDREYIWLGDCGQACYDNVEGYYILDDQRRVRGGFRADGSEGVWLHRVYEVLRDGNNKVVITEHGKVIKEFHGKITPSTKAARAWLSEHRPGWTSPLKYW